MSGRTWSELLPHLCSGLWQGALKHKDDMPHTYLALLTDHMGQEPRTQPIVTLFTMELKAHTPVIAAFIIENAASSSSIHWCMLRGHPLCTSVLTTFSEGNKPGVHPVTAL